MKRGLIALVFVTLAALLGGCLDSQDVEVAPLHGIDCPGSAADCQQCGAPPKGATICPNTGIGGWCAFEPAGCFSCSAQFGQNRARWQIIHIACDTFPDHHPDGGTDAQ